jgi:hypothetical protein
VHPIFGGMNTCVEYSATEKFCGRPCTQGCPDGFTCGSENVCIRAQGCDPDPVICPQDPNGGADCGRMAPSQICPGAECEGTGGAQCSTNNQPGALGICIGFCDENSDCTDPGTPICNLRNGICIAGCTKGSCPAAQVCHSDGFCAAPCADDADCTDDPKYGPSTYCNIPPPPARPPPRYYKGGPQGYRDDFACAPLGCERKVDCVVPGVVCDLAQAPPACVPGCYENLDCRAGEKCKVPNGPPPGTEQECRMLADKPEGESSIGLCCDPGCEDLELDCGFNEFCCGEDKDPAIMEPYENASACLPTTATAAQALPGECFEMGTDPWCRTCANAFEECPASGWSPGFAEYPENSGMLSQEEEWCYPISMTNAVCTVTCNPDLELLELNMCPRLWGCRPFMMPCFQDADCGGLTCVGANPGMNIPGACRCGENGAPTATCPMTTLQGFMFDRPRCVEFGTNLLSSGGWPGGVTGGMPGEFYCVASFHCTPPPLQVDMMTGDTNYPDACGF